jgi:hypothetical protein
MTAGRAAALALKEADRLVNVREGDKVLTLPAIRDVACVIREAII